MGAKSLHKKIILGLQHVLAMFGATVLVPALTGLDTSITLFCAGTGTLLFHLITKKKVPVFLGSSFAFMVGIMAVLGDSRIGDADFMPKLAAVKGAIIVAGLVYVLFAILIKLLGYEKVNKLLPPIVTGPIIVVIGLRLSGVAINSAFYLPNEAGESVFSLKAVLVTVIVLAVCIGISVFAKGIYNLMPILFAIVVGYIVCIPLGLVDFSPVRNANFISLLDENIRAQVFLLPTFELDAILAIAPIALVTLIEHIGDITTNGAVCGKNFMDDPGVHRTLLGDGIATAWAGLLGGPANTTYSENTGVLAVTKNYDPFVIRIAAVIAVVLGIIGKFGILVNSRLNFGNSRNLMIAAVIFVLGIGCDSIPISDTVSISGLALAAIAGIILAIILPVGRDNILEKE